MDIHFTKMQGAGNDFVLLEAKKINSDWTQMAVDMCDRHYGIGADGLLVLLPSQLAKFRMRMFNPDGSEAEACGNGLRCIAKYILDMGLADAGVEELFVETLGGVRGVKFNKTKGEAIEIQVSMGAPKFDAQDIPVIVDSEEDNVVDIKPILQKQISLGSRELLLNLVSMGNPHAIYFEQYPISGFPLFQIGPEVEQHKVFPNRINFEVANILNQNQIEARVWERGVGETLACGSGACAVAVAAQILGYIGSEVSIKLPGGTLAVKWDKKGEVQLSGPTETVFTGKWSR